MKSNASRPAILLSEILLEWLLIIVFVVFHFMRTSLKKESKNAMSIFHSNGNYNALVLFMYFVISYYRSIQVEKSIRGGYYEQANPNWS